MKGEACRGIVSGGRCVKWGYDEPSTLHARFRGRSRHPTIWHESDSEAPRARRESIKLLHLTFHRVGKDRLAAADATFVAVHVEELDAAAPEV